MRSPKAWWLPHLAHPALCPPAWRAWEQRARRSVVSPGTDPMGGFGTALNLPAGGQPDRTLGSLYMGSRTPPGHTRKRPHWGWRTGPLPHREQSGRRAVSSPSAPMCAVTHAHMHTRRHGHPPAILLHAGTLTLKSSSHHTLHREIHTRVHTTPAIHIYVYICPQTCTHRLSGHPPVACAPTTINMHTYIHTKNCPIPIHVCVYAGTHTLTHKEHPSLPLYVFAYRCTQSGLSPHPIPAHTHTQMHQSVHPHSILTHA